jgi:hypothetical protein
MREGESFEAICGFDQVEKLRRVAVHNGGELRVAETTAAGVRLTVRKAAASGQE